MSNMSLVVECLYSVINTTNSSFIRKVTMNECRFSQLAGVILLIVAIISLVINIHSLMAAKKHRQGSPHDQRIYIGMFISALCVIIISTPSVLLQCFLCHRLCSAVICRLEGFNSFFNGCTTMYLLVALSLIRYIKTTNSSFSKSFQRKVKRHHLSLVMICFITGSIWAIPPVFGHMSTYVPEGLGFHCGLNWFDRSLASRIYFLLLFICVYFIPMIIIIYINIHIQRTIYRLTHLYPSVLFEMDEMNNQDLLRRHISPKLCDKAVRRLHHLYEDRRFVVATKRSVIIYLIAWTPYSVIALSQVFGSSFSLYEPWLMTVCALLAKVSMIINPIVYTVLLKSRSMSINGIH